MLNRLFSETNLLLKDINFEHGINIVLGKYSGDKDAKGINGIGKSSVIRLINYVLLSDTAEKTFNQPKYNFLRDEEHSITLEFTIKNKKHFVKRNFAESDTVLIGKTPKSFHEYTKQDAIILLGNLFFPVENTEVVIMGNKYRTLLQFFVKDDLHNIQRIDPLDFFNFPINATDKAIYNFYLLNIPTTALWTYADVSKEYKQYKDTLTGLTSKVLADTGKGIEEFKTEKIKIELKIDQLRESLKTYNFTITHKEIEIKLSEIIGKINDRSQQYQELSSQLKKIRESYQYNQDIDTKQIQKIYNETISHFGNIVAKTIEEIKRFKSELLDNRNKYLLERENELQKEIDKTFGDLAKLEQSRSSIFLTLKEKGALDKIEATYEKLIEEKSLLEKNMQIVLQVDEIGTILTNTEVALSEIKRDIITTITSHEKNIQSLRTAFQEILQTAIFLNEDAGSGYFGLSPEPNSRKNSLPFKLEVNIPKADALGQERLKIIAYDLMIFLMNIQRKRTLPDFLIHDGVFHGIAHDRIVNILNYVYSKHLKLFAQKHQFQYIVTFNENEIETPNGKESTYGEMSFDWKQNVCIQLEDTPNKMLFKRDFK